MKLLAVSAAAAAILGLAACQRDPVQTSAADRQALATQTTTNQADRKVGMPAITNFAERKFAKEVYEDRDKALVTFAYLQGIDGRLSCLGQGIGYGIPYAVQFTAPHYPQEVYVQGRHYDGTPAPGSIVTENLEQPEPNGLFMPDNAEASWYRLLDPQTGKVRAVYIEPRMTISPVELTGPIVAAPCAHSAALERAKAGSESSSVAAPSE